MRWPLRYQILFPFGGVMLAVVLGVSLLDAVLAARRTQRQIEHQLNEVSQTLLDATFPLTDAVLRQTRGLSGAEFLLTDQQGNLRASSLAPIDVGRIPLEANAGREFRLGDPITLASGDFFHTAIAIRERGMQAEPLLLHILYPRGYLREARWQAAYPPLLLGSVLLGVVIVLAVVIAGRLSRPILDLRRELGRLVKGDFRPLPAPRRNDEMSDLIGSVNVLGEELDELRRAIKRSERLALLGQLSGGLAHQLRNSVTGGADRRSAPSAALPCDRSRKPGRRAATIIADRITPAAIFDRRPALGPAPPAQRSAADHARCGGPGGAVVCSPGRRFAM